MFGLLFGCEVVLCEIGLLFVGWFVYVVGFMFDDCWLMVVCGVGVGFVVVYNVLFGGVIFVFEVLFGMFELCVLVVVVVIFVIVVIVVWFGFGNEY